MSDVTRFEVRWPDDAPNVNSGEVSYDPAERIHNRDAYGDEGSRVVTLRLPLSRAEMLCEALELVDATAEMWQSGAEAPSCWQEWTEALGAAIDLAQQ